MAIKITQAKGQLKKLLKIIKRDYLSGAKVLLKRKIISEMKKGESPVKRGRWDTPYSDSYKKLIRRGKLEKKRISPINLKNEGDMHKSLEIKGTFDKLDISFPDEGPAKYHDKEGAGKIKAIRRMLPTRRGEEFNDDINRDLDKLLNNVIKKTVRKF